MRKARWSLHAMTAIALIAMALAGMQMQALAQPADDKLVVPGERIGPLKLASRLADLEAMYGRATPQGRGLWDLSTMYGWDAIGLRVIAGTTGNVLWMSVCPCGSNPWAGFTTAEGLGFGATEEQVRAAMGPPSRTVGDASGKALHFAAQGIAFVFESGGPQADKVSGVYVYWKHRSPGDTVVVLGRRISSVTVGAPVSAVQSQLGTGFTYVRPGNFEVYHWPSYALAIFVQDGRVVQVDAYYDEYHDDLKIRYATTQGLGIGSTREEVRAAFGEPPQRELRGPIEAWVYMNQGIVFNVAISGSLTGRIVGVGVFAPR